jgi:hypothetical protein
LTVGLLTWVLGVCPAIGWLLAFVWLEATDPPIIALGIVFAVPALLGAAGAVFARRSFVGIAVAAIGASSMVGLASLVTYMYRASQGHFQ